MSHLVELDLRSEPGSPADAGWKPIVLNLLRLLGEASSANQSKETTELAARLAEHRRQLSGQMHPQEERQVAAVCVSTCDKYLRGLQMDHAARENELFEMITLLREATARLVGDSSEFNEAVQSSADRFREITRFEDLRELKRELSNEASKLEHAIEEKKQRDREAMAKLSQRVEFLTADLEKAEEKATTDPLTRVANRGGFDRALTAMIDNSRRSGLPLTLAMIDIDHFKQINDTYGHPVGDRVLLCAAEWIKASVRQTDFVARYGGEEFAVLLAGADLTQAEHRFRSVLQNIASRSYEFEQDGETRSIRFTVSCGVSQLADADTEKDFVKRADQALYEAKDKGRNRVATRKSSRLARLLGR